MDWEQWLRTAAKPPSENEESKREKTENEIKSALAKYEPLKGRPYIVYVKGSYANNTNVRLNYDVDIAVEYQNFFDYDMEFGLKGKTLADVGAQVSTDPYTREDFKTDIRAALVAAYGSSAVKDGEIAYRVRQKKTTLPADVVPCWLYRRYDGTGFNGPIYHEGSRVYPRSGSHKTNYPKIQLKKGTEKNNRTGHRYKRMVRALKKLQTRIVENGELPKELPSYFIECLVYNVPDASFNHADDYLADMSGVLMRIYNAMLSDGNGYDWLHVHELVYLFRGDDSWSQADAQALALAAWNELELG
jgi:hypothetical protein